MALMRCPECGSDVSSEAYNCPKCGIGIKYWTTGRILIAIVIIFVAFGGCYVVRLQMTVVPEKVTFDYKTPYVSTSTPYYNPADGPLKSADSSTQKFVALLATHCRNSDIDILQITDRMISTIKSNGGQSISRSEFFMKAASIIDAAQTDPKLKKKIRQTDGKLEFNDIADGVRFLITGQNN